jgi:pyruvate ferredoxin oxidoreductase beta subunit/2-oxoisovalerate ferredoxin oxidoreductase beta subunit
MDYVSYPDTNNFMSGHAACPGCVEALAMRIILNKVGDNAIAVVPPSCTAVICGPHPNSSLKIPVFHTTLEAAASAACGVRRSLNSQGKHDTTVLVMAGDGGTYDIGFQALSSAVERNEDILYICFDNEGYMNTGGQKSSSTPINASTGSTPAGKHNKKKNMMEILAAHEIPYAATATPGHIDDLARKMDKAIAMKGGFRFISVLIPCLDGWGIADHLGVTSARLAVETGMWPLYEIENGVKYTLNWENKDKPVDDYLKLQKRYRHMGEDELSAVQAATDQDWSRLLMRIENSDKEFGAATAA